MRTAGGIVGNRQAGRQRAGSARAEVDARGCRLLPGASVPLPPPALMLKLPGFALDNEMPLMVSGPVPLLESVTLCGALVVPTSWLPKSRSGVRLTAGVGTNPMPSNGT